MPKKHKKPKRARSVAQRSHEPSPTNPTAVRTPAPQPFVKTLSRIQPVAFDRGRQLRRRTHAKMGR